MRGFIILLLLLVSCGPGHGHRPQDKDTMYVCEGNTGQTMRCTRVSRDEFETEMRQRGRR